jgi:hypothetical protein
LPCLAGSEYYLEIKLEQQLKSRWCWGALACAIAGYYETMNVQQAQLAGELIKDSDTGHEIYALEDRQEKNVNFKLDVVLKYVGCFSHWSAGKPNFDRLKFEINQGRPLCVRLEWFKGGAHYIMIKGYDWEKGTVLIDDPLHGLDRMPFENFPEKYRVSGAVWTETYWTNRQIFK